MIVGRVAGLRRYPIKSLRGERLDVADVTASGVAGDRTSALFVRSGHARVAKTYRGKENDRLHLLTDADAAQAVARDCGVETEQCSGERFFDTAPISVLVDVWIAALSEHVGYAVAWERFRPNIFIRADSRFTVLESALVGTELRCGAVRLRVRKPIERCVVITYDLDGGRADPEILRFVAERRAATMGIYCDVVTAGAIAVGDECSQIGARKSEEAPFTTPLPTPDERSVVAPPPARRNES